MDFNGDGYKDLIVGERNGWVNFFQRNSDKTLQAGVKLKANEADIQVCNNSSPEVVDWNGDGLLDLLLACDSLSPKPIRLYLNSGTKTQYRFTTYSILKSGNTEIKYYRTQIQSLDFNYDGKLDLLVANGLSTKETRIYFYENIGTISAPSLKAPVALMAKSGQAIYPDIGYDITFDVADWNSDGAWDIIMGDYYPGTKIKLWLGDPTTTGVSDNIANHASINPLSWHLQNGTLSVKAELTKPKRIDFSIVTSDGRTLKNVTHDMMGPGMHTVTCSIGDLANGIYFVHYRINEMSAYNKIVITR